jgi:hypothetical protein
MTDRVKKPRNDYANSGEVSKDDAALLETPSGRDEGRAAVGAAFQEDVGSIRQGGKARGDISSQGVAGSERETIDGLNETDESVRRSTEDVPVGGRP